MNRDDRIATNYFHEVGREEQPTAAEETRNFTELLLARQRLADAQKRLKRARKKGAADEVATLESNSRLWSRKIARLEQEIPKGYLRFVIKVARKYTKDQQQLQELIGAGNCGLMDAVYRFDVAFGTRFLTYADHWINVRIQEYLNRDSLVHVPNHVRKGMRKQRRAEEAEMVLGVRTQHSFEEPSVTGVDPETLAQVVEPPSATAETLMAYMSEAGLSRRERLALVYTHGLADGVARNPQEVADRFYALDGSILRADEVLALVANGTTQLRDYLGTIGVFSAGHLL